MISSGYFLSEIEVIFTEEVAPVVYSNSYQLTGGEWRNFDPEWLHGAILENLAKQKRNPIYRAWVEKRGGKIRHDETGARRLGESRRIIPIFRPNSGAPVKTLSERKSGGQRI